MPGNNSERRRSFKELEQNLIEQIAISVLQPNSSQNSSRRNSDDPNVALDYEFMHKGIKTLKTG